MLSMIEGSILREEPVRWCETRMFGMQCGPWMNIARVTARDGKCYPLAYDFRTRPFGHI